MGRTGHVLLDRSRSADAHIALGGLCEVEGVVAGRVVAGEGEDQRAKESERPLQRKGCCQKRSREREWDTLGGVHGTH